MNWQRCGEVESELKYFTAQRTWHVDVDFRQRPICREQEGTDSGSTDGLGSPPLNATIHSKLQVTRSSRSDEQIQSEYSDLKA